MKTKNLEDGMHGKVLKFFLEFSANKSSQTVSPCTTDPQTVGWSLGWLLRMLGSPNMRALFVTTPWFFKKLMSPVVAGMHAGSSCSLLVLEATGISIHL